MSHAVRVVDPPFPTSGGCTVEAVPAATDNLVWLVARGDAAWVVDGPSAADVRRRLHERGLGLAGVLITHTHGDHVGILRDLARDGALAGVEVVAPRAVAAEVPVEVTRSVGEGDRFEVLGRPVGVWETEGHLRGHVSYLLDDVLFCGDTLFAGGCGRAFQDVGLLHRSLERLAGLPAETRVCCAHEYTLDNLRFAAWAEPDNPAVTERLAAVAALRADGRAAVPSTIGLERATNPFLRTHVPGIGGATGTPASVFAALRAAKDRAVHRPAPGAPPTP